MDPVLPAGPGNPDDQYGHSLGTAYDYPTVPDPDFALIQDPLIYHKVRLDPVFEGIMQFRRLLEAGSEWRVEPGGDDDPSRRLAAIVEALAGRISRFAEARYNMSEAVFRGSAWLYPEGGRETLRPDGTPPLSWWVPRFLRHVDKRRFRLTFTGIEEKVCADGKRHKIRINRWEIFNTTERRWNPIELSSFIHHVYDDSEDTLSHGRGLLGALYYVYRAKVAAMREMAMMLERFGQGTTVFSIDSTAHPPPVGKSTDQLLREAAASVEKHKARHVMAKLKEDELSIIDMPRGGFDAFQAALTYYDDAARQLILGSKLPTGGGPPVGSLARAQVEERSTESVIEYGHAISGETLTRDLVGLILRLNRPNLIRLGLAEAVPPKMVILGRKHADPSAFAALAAQVLGAGGKIRQDEFYAGVGLTPPRPGEPVIEPIAPPPMFGPPGTTAASNQGGSHASQQTAAVGGSPESPGAHRWGNGSA